MLLPISPATPVCSSCSCSSESPRAPRTASQRSHKAEGRRPRDAGTHRPSHTARWPPGASRPPYTSLGWVSDEAPSASEQTPG